MNELHKELLAFQKEFPRNVAWRLGAHSKAVLENLQEDEKILFAFPAQGSLYIYNLFSTYVVVFTNKRVMIVHKKLLWGYILVVISPNLFNDLTTTAGIIWGNIKIDTVKEVRTFRYIDKRALPGLSKNIYKYFKIYGKKEEKNKDLDNA